MADYIKPAVVMAALAASRYLDEKDPDTIFYLRAAFVTSFLASAGPCYGLIYLRIQSKRDNTQFQLQESDLDPNAGSPLAAYHRQVSRPGKGDNVDALASTTWQSSRQP